MLDDGLVPSTTPAITPILQGFLLTLVDIDWLLTDMLWPFASCSEKPVSLIIHLIASTYEDWSYGKDWWKFWMCYGTKSVFGACLPTWTAGPKTILSMVKAELQGLLMDHLMTSPGLAASLTGWAQEKHGHPVDPLSAEMHLLSMLWDLDLVRSTGSACRVYFWIVNRRSWVFCKFWIFSSKTQRHSNHSVTIKG